MLSAEEIQDLSKKANKVRRDIIEMLVEAGSGHSGGPLGMADIFTLLYFKVLNIDPDKPEMENRDRLVLSNGHICPVLYATMAERGYFPVSELKTLRKLGSRLQGHPHRSALPGLETTSGPLGSGLSQACGMALVAKTDEKKWLTYCLMSDGEQDEGNTWEAVMFAYKYKLDNLIAIIDRNNIQIDGTTNRTMPLGDLGEKYEQFGWFVQDVNGHDFDQLYEAIEKAKQQEGKPSVIIAHTIPGKGVSYMEGRYEWHGMPPDLQEVEGAPKKGEQAKKALEELTDD